MISSFVSLRGCRGAGGLVECHVSRFQTKERRHAEAVSAALERRRIAKKKKAVMAVKRERAAVSIALNEEKQAKQKVRYQIVLLIIVIVVFLPLPATWLWFLLFLFLCMFLWARALLTMVSCFSCGRCVIRPIPLSPGSSLLLPRRPRHHHVNVSRSACLYYFGTSIVSPCLRTSPCAPLQATYEAGFREAALIFHEREQRKVGAHFTLTSFSIASSMC